jgi:hypothetical protein
MDLARRSPQLDRYSYVSNLFSDCASTDHLLELVTKALAAWEAAVYPRPASYRRRQMPQEHELPAPRDLGCWGHMQMSALYAWKSARGLSAHEWAHESRTAR